MNNIHGTPNLGHGGSDELQKRYNEYNEFLIRELKKLQPNKLIESIIEKLHAGELHAPTTHEHGGSDRRE